MTRLFRRLRARLRYRHFDADLRRELDVHRAMAEDELRASGETADDVRHRAARQLGNVTLARESARGVWIPAWLEGVRQDGRYAARALIAHRNVTAAAAVMLALAIGITTAMFTVVDALVFRAVPFRDPAHLALVLMGNDRGVRGSTVPAAVWRAWRETAAFESVESAVPDSALIEVGDTVVARGVAAVTPGVFEMLGGVRPLRGRLFHATEGRRGQSDRVLLSEVVWRSLYGADDALVGRSITVDDKPLIVVGILPADFRFPSATTVMWRPTDLGGTGERARPIVRFAPGMPREDALRLATGAARAADPADQRANRLALASPVAGLSDAYSTRALPLMAGGVFLVFLVLCANASGLLLARATMRRREFSMRSVLGASRGRLMRQALVEGGLLASLGVVTGTGVAWALVGLTRVLLPEPILAQTLNLLDLDARALVASSAAGLAATLIAGLLPAWLGTRVNAGDALRAADRGGTEARGARLLMRTLLVGEVALACTLLVGAALLTRSFVNLAGADRGLVTSGVTTAWLTLPSAEGSAEATAAMRETLVRSIEEELRALPGVQQLAWSYGIPPEGGFQDTREWVSDSSEIAVAMALNHYVVSPEFFSLYGIPILGGRGFTAADTFTDVVVGEQFAHALWRDGDPVGRTFRSGPDGVTGSLMQPGQQATYRVIGLARETHYPSMDRDPTLDGPEIYHPYTTAPTPMLSLRCVPVCDPAAVRHRLASTHPAVGARNVRLAADHYGRELARPRASAALATAFAAIAVTASAGGLLSVLSYAVNRRRREFGIRMALGASSREIRRVVLRDGLFVAVAGLGIGSLLAAALVGMLASLQYGVTSADPVSWSIVFGVIVLTAVAASWGPARAASRIDPLVLLREE